MKKHGVKKCGTIAIVAPAIAREGITKQIANQIIGLQQFHVSVCLIVIAKSEVGLLQEYQVDMSQVPILQLHQTTPYLSPGAFVGSVNIIKPILWYLKEHTVTSVIAHAPYSHFVLRLTRLAAPIYNLNFNLIQYFHGLQYSEYPLTTMRRIAVNNLNKWLAKRYDSAHISVSEVVRQEVRRSLIEVTNHAVLYNSVSSKSSYLAEEVWQGVQPILQQADGKYKILIPNRIDYNKGQLFFLTVLEKFFRSQQIVGTDITVLIVGDGPQRQEVEQVVRQNHLEKTVILTGALPNAVVQKLMQKVQLVLVPSFKEGLPFSVLEALTAKCLVLASRTGGIPEIIQEGKTGFLFEPGNSEDCLKQLRFIYDHRDKTLIDGDAIDKDINEKFSIEENSQKLLRLLSIETK